MGAVVRREKKGRKDYVEEEGKGLGMGEDGGGRRWLNPLAFSTGTFVNNGQRWQPLSLFVSGDPHQVYR